MNRNFKVGDWVIYIDKKDSNNWKIDGSPSLYKKLAKIIHIDKEKFLSYTIEFKEWVNGFAGDGKGNEGHCVRCHQNEFKSAINHLKFKKWIKG